MKTRVLLFYKYVNVENPTEVMERERAVCNVLGLKGRIIIAHEGINGTVEGSVEETEKYIAHLRSDKRFRDMYIKESEGDGKAFPRLSIKVKPEIVSTKFGAHIDPRKKTGKYLQPHDLKRMYENNDEFVVIDMRNEFEIASGYFKNTVNPGLTTSRDLAKPEIIEKLKIHKDKKCITVCTGGVRCEKMSAFLIDQGFENVYQLHNGMHGYMEKYPGQDFLGTLYTFDDRKVMDFGGERTVVGKCLTCGTASERYENCANMKCHDNFITCNSCMESFGGVAYCSDDCKVKWEQIAHATV
jgi:UPF0176 protein